MPKSFYKIDSWFEFAKGKIWNWTYVFEMSYRYGHLYWPNSLICIGFELPPPSSITTSSEEKNGYLESCYEVNFTNILIAAFLTIFLCQKSTNLKCKCKKSTCKTFGWKSCAQNVGEIYSRIGLKNELFVIISNYNCTLLDIPLFSSVSFAYGSKQFCQMIS